VKVIDQIREMIFESLNKRNGEDVTKGVKHELRQVIEEIRKVYPDMVVKDNTEYYKKYTCDTDPETDFPM